MTTHHTVRIELATREDLGADILTSLASYGSSVRRGTHGHVVLELTLPADDVVQAVQTAVALTRSVVSVAVVSVEALPAEQAGRRAGLDPVPPLLSVSETAAALGITRQAVLQRIESGSLPATRVGSAWVLPTSAVDHARDASGRQRESLADVAASWDGAGRWPQDTGADGSTERSGPNAFDPIPLPPGANIGSPV